MALNWYQNILYYRLQTGHIAENVRWAFLKALMRSSALRYVG